MRRIKKAAIKFISLVPAGANLVDTVYKSDGTFTVGTLLKASDNFDEAGELTAVVYTPNFRDAQGDIADADVVKQMAHDFIAHGASIDINHDGKPLPREKARVAETFLVQKTDSRFHGWKDRNGNAVDLAGAWATVIKIDDPELRKKYRSGDWAGVSMGGTAVVEAEKSFDLLHNFVELLSKAPALSNHRTNEPKSTDMTPQELQTILDQNNKTVLASVAEMLKTLAPKAEEKQTSGFDFPPHVLNNPRLLKKALRAAEQKDLIENTLKQGDPIGYKEGLAELRKTWAAEDAAEKGESVGPAQGVSPLDGFAGGQVVAKNGDKFDLPTSVAGLPLADKTEAALALSGELLAKSLRR
jgi:hypothetical protein